MIRAILKGIEQLSDPATRRVLWLAVGMALAVFIALWGIVAWLLTSTALFANPWLDAAIDFLGGLATLVVTWLLFPAVVSAGIGLLLDRVANAVERRHYPHLPPARDPPILEIVGVSLRFLVALLVLNLLVLLVIIIPPVFPFVFYGVNGYLLGREYFELVALRRLDAAAAKRVWADHRGAMILAGIGFAVLLTVPFVNLVAPVLATAATVHLVEGWRNRAEAVTSAQRGTPG